jgi:hypothetical protein
MVGHSKAGSLVPVGLTLNNIMSGTTLENARRNLSDSMQK